MADFTHLQNWCCYDFWFYVAVRDLVITLSTKAYNVNNNLDEVLLAIVCIAFHENIITRSSLVPKVAVIRAFVALGSRVYGRRDKLMIAC